jgi:two-component system sensor histidine kinase DegS
LKTTVRGFNTGKIRSSGSGFGLLGIAERTRIFDGVFEVHSTVGRGTVISIELPDESKLKACCEGFNDRAFD